MVFDKPINITVVSVNPRTFQYVEVFSDITIKDTAEVFEQVKAVSKFNNTIIVVVTAPQQFVNNLLQTKIIDCNVEKPNILGKLFHYGLEMLAEKQADLVEAFTEKKDFGINEEEKAAFKSIIDRFPNLVLAKSTFDGIPTMVICDTVEGEVDMQLKPLALIINEEIFAKLTPPDDIDNLTK